MKKEILFIILMALSCLTAFGQSAVAGVSSIASEFPLTVDHDNDGYFDDFFYCNNAQLVRREIDSNSDGLIDIWIYLENGIYVYRYERDFDFDGEVDLSQDFSVSPDDY